MRAKIWLINALFRSCEFPDGCKSRFKQIHSKFLKTSSPKQQTTGSCVPLVLLSNYFIISETTIILLNIYRNDSN